MAPQPSIRRNERVRLVWWWRLALLTPAAYMLASVAVGRLAFANEPRPGFWPQASDDWQAMRGAAAGAGLGLTLLVVWLRRRRNAGDTTAYERTSFVMLAVCDLIAFLGLVMYLVQGDADAQAALSLLAWFNYAVSRPGVQ